jgi:hypothetical protein
VPRGGLTGERERERDFVERKERESWGIDRKKKTNLKASKTHKTINVYNNTSYL